jgi:hypothetical protein
LASIFFLEASLWTPHLPALALSCQLLRPAAQPKVWSFSSSPMLGIPSPSLLCPLSYLLYPLGFLELILL